MNTDNKYHLVGFLSNFKVRIPILQRDFAQGRNKQKNIRERFLNDLLTFLESDLDEKNLDFIYGYNESDRFLPIDGQQRLTTLWLLHVFLSSKLEDRSPFKDLKNFTYATRETANSFCEEILDFTFKGIPSEDLRDGHYMFGRINDGDPTVDSMLNMLDAIEKKFRYSDFTQVTSRLNRIKFHVIQMEDFQLGEDLYIKMNSRGKQLSTFENFKSWIQKDDVIRENYKLISEIDNKWINFFWQNARIVDGANWEDDIIQMFYYLAIFFTLQNSNFTTKNSQDFIENNLNASFDIFDETLFTVDNESIFTLDVLEKTDKIIDFFIELQGKGFTLPKFNVSEKTPNFLLVPKLFAIFFYALSGKDVAYYEDWQDTTNHLIDNTRPQTDRAHINSFFTLLEGLSEHCDNIVAFLAQTPEEKTGFAKDRLNEEKRKAKIITNDGRGGKWEIALNKAQNHSYFKGWIEFLLTYSYSEQDDDYLLKSFKNYAESACEVFEKRFLECHLRLLQRTILSYGDYLVYNSHWYLGSDVGTLQHGKEQWMRMYREHPEIFKAFFSDFFSERTKNTSKVATEILSDLILKNMKKKWFQRDWWIWLLVFDEKYLDYCQQHRIAFSDDSDMVYLIPSSRLQTRGISLIGYGLYSYILNGKKHKLSELNDRFKEKNLFIVDKKITIYVNEYTSTIVVVKRGFGSKPFTFDYEESDTLTLDNHYKKIVNYIKSIS